MHAGKIRKSRGQFREKVATAGDVARLKSVEVLQPKPAMGIKCWAPEEIDCMRGAVHETIVVPIFRIACF